MGRCSECGSETDRLTPSGVCVWRAGCEHRVMQHTETMRRLNDELAAFDLEPCGHSRAEHRAMLAAHPSRYMATTMDAGAAATTSSAVSERATASRT